MKAPRATIKQLEQISNLSKNVPKAVYDKCRDRFYVRKFYSMKQADKVIECLEQEQRRSELIRELDELMANFKRKKRDLKE